MPLVLDVIAGKAMAHARGDRYPTASDLASDVQRWLADEPVSAHRDEFSTRLLRWTRRHRIQVTSAMVLVVTAAVASTIGLAVVSRERGKTAEQRDFARSGTTARPEELCAMP